MAGKTKTTELEIIYWSKGGNNIILWTGPVPHGVRLRGVTPDWIGTENGILTLSFSGNPVKIEKDDGIHFDIGVVALPEKRCGNCKHSYEGGCNHCAGDNFGSFTEIVSWAEGCGNWEAQS